MTIQVKTLCMA